MSPSEFIESVVSGGPMKVMPAASEREDSRAVRAGDLRCSKMALDFFGVFLANSLAVGIKSIAPRNVLFWLERRISLEALTFSLNSSSWSPVVASWVPAAGQTRDTIMGLTH